MEEKKGKKLIVVFIIAIVVLLGAIVAISYAMFSASLTGVKENKLVTGSVSMSCAETNFTLENTSAMSDEEGIALENNEATCTLTTTLRGTMTIGYDVALYDVDKETPSDAVGESNVKIQASKVKGGTTTYLANSTATTGVLVSSIKNQAGQYDNTITNYKIDSATTTQSEEVLYKIKAWVSSLQDGSTTNTNTDGKCSDSTKTTKADCVAAGEVWGYEQKQNQAGGTFSFKLKAGAKQVLD